MEQAQTIHFTKTMSLANMIAAGKYDAAHSVFTQKNFPKDFDGEVALPYLHHFERPISAEDALKEFFSQSLRTATLPELLLFGANYPKEQKMYPIVALDFEQDGGRGSHIPALCYGDYQRCLSPFRVGKGWVNDDWRFAVVRK